jgi:hypothetical protein
MVLAFFPDRNETWSSPRKPASASVGAVSRQEPPCIDREFCDSGGWVPDKELVLQIDADADVIWDDPYSVANFG